MSLMSEYMVISTCQCINYISSTQLEDLEYKVILLNCFICIVHNIKYDLMIYV